MFCTAQPTEVATHAYKSWVHPEGFDAVMVAWLQSVCCHI